MLRKISDNKILGTIWDNSVSGLAMVASDGTLLKANKSFCDLVEYTEAELKELTFADITHPDDLVIDLRLSKRVEKGELAGYDMRKRYITKSGKVVWTLLRVNSLLDDKDKFICYISQVALIDQALKEKPTTSIWSWLTPKWPVIVTAVSVISYILAEAWKRISL